MFQIIYNLFITPLHPLRWRHNGSDSVSKHQPHDIYSTVYSDADQRKYKSSAPLALCGEFTGDRKMVAFDDVIMKSEVSTFPIVIIFFRGCVPEMFVTSYSVTYCIYIPEKKCFYYDCAVYDEYKYLDTFWLTPFSLSSLCKLTWRHWAYKMSVRYILSSMWVR